MDLDNHLVFLGLLSIACLVCPAFSTRCPPAEDIIPCQCYDDDDYLRLQCYEVDVDLDDLKRIMNVFQKACSMFEVELFWLKLGTIPSDYFQGFSIRVLEFSNCEIELPTDGGQRPFTGLENCLETLLIISCFHGDNSLTRLDLTHLNSLVYLDVSHNAIAEIGDQWHANVPLRLRGLILMDNGIRRIGTNAFANFPNLERFCLYANRFGEVRRSLLPNPANYLHELDLDDNALSSLPEDFFIGMPALRTLSLRNNRFTTLPERTFMPVWQQLEEFDISENPLDCDDFNIEWMYRVQNSPAIEGTCQSPPETAGMNLAELIQSRRNELQGKENDETTTCVPMHCNSME